MKNTGETQDTFRMSGRCDTPGWKVRYFDAATGGSDVSALVKSNGYTLTLASNTRRELRIEVTPDASVPQDQAKDVPVSVRSEGNSLYSDQITAQAVRRGLPPTPTRAVDAAIRLAAQIDYNGVGIVSPSAPNAAQTVDAPASNTSAAVYHWRVQNKGVASEKIKLTLPATPAGWTLHLFDALDPGPNVQDITAAAQSETGYETPSLSPDGFMELRLEVKPDAGTTGTLATDLTAASVGDTTQTDVCATSTTAAQTTTISPVVTFVGTPRALAGGIDNTLHKMTLTLDAKQNGVAMAGASFKLSFENNVGHNYGTATAPDIRHRAKIFDASDPAAPWKETLDVTTNAQGQVQVTVLSSDVISQPRLIARWTNAGETETVGGVKLDFAQATSKRGFPDPVVGAYEGWEAHDTGWTCDFGAVENEGDTTTASLQLRFRDSQGNFQPVAGHTVEIRMGRLNIADGSRVYDADESENYITFLNGAVETGVVTATTDASGVAQVILKAKSGVADVKSIELAAQSVTQWAK